MSDTNARLWSRRDGFVADRFVHGTTPDDAGNHVGVILPLDDFLALDPEALAGRTIGVSVKPGQPIEPLLPHLGRIAVVALHYPAFNDGRSSSKAAVLRGRHGFAGELRAFGDILIDQVPLLLRCGFDTLEVTHPLTIRRLEEGVSFDPRLYYQPGIGSTPATGGFAWRRVPAA
jgi:uncharacterized protein (DUF934 family)